MKVKFEVVVKGSYDHALQEGHRLVPTSARNAKISVKRRSDTDVYDVTVNYENTLKDNNFSVQDFCNNLKTTQKGK